MSITIRYCPLCHKNNIRIAVKENNDGEQDKFYGEITCMSCGAVIGLSKYFWTYEEAENEMLKMLGERE